MQSINNHTMRTKCPIDMKQMTLERECYGCTLLIQFPIPTRVKWGWENHSYLLYPIFNRSSLTFIL